MNNINNILEITNFILYSSTEVPQVIVQVKELQKQQILVHITSYLHNTVLVQNLKRDLLKIIPDANLILLKHEDKSKTLLSVFTLDKDTGEVDISNEVLKELHLEITKTTYNGIKYIKNELSNCKIIWKRPMLSWLNK